VKAKTSLLKKIIRGECWKVRYVQKTKQEVRFEKFIEFLPLEGLGSDVKTLDRLCHDDEESLLMLSDATIGSMEATENQRRQETGISRLIISVLILSRMVQVAHPLCAVSAKTGRSWDPSARPFFGRLSPARSAPALVSGSGRWASSGGLQLLRERRMAQLLN
jgi:hypothetical protein